MGNIVIASLYQRGENEKETLINRFLKSNVQNGSSEYIQRDPNYVDSLIEVIEIESLKAKIVNFINLNVTKLSEFQFSRIIKHTVNSINTEIESTPFKFIFYFPYSKIDESLSLITLFLDSSNEKIINSMYLIVVNDSYEKENLISDQDVELKCKCHLELQKLIKFSSNDNFISCFPRKEKVQDDLLKLLFSIPNCYLNLYAIEKKEVGKNDEDHFTINNVKLTSEFKKAEMIGQPIITQNIIDSDINLNADLEVKLLPNVNSNQSSSKSIKVYLIAGILFVGAIALIWNMMN